jgi:hypothetical protein
VGTNTGTLANTYTNDNQYFTIQETQSFDYQFQFGRDEAVPTTAVSLHLYGWYNGEEAHTVKLYQWNYTTSAWTAVTANIDDFPRAASKQIYQYNLINDGNYLSAGKIKIRFLHSVCLLM